jgi:superfamily II DNA/RNA helicase
MYNKSFSGGQRGHKSRFGSVSRKPFARGGFSNRRKFSQKGERIDINKFVSKASVFEEDVFVPKHKFSDFNIQESLKGNILKKGYQNPTPIQDLAIPSAILGNDILGIANTGTGKTGAFLIPLINKVLQNRKEQVLIIVPTRELALQVEQEFRSLTVGLKMYSVCVVGGMSIAKQIKDLRYEYNFIIGTPGRLKDLVMRKHIFLDEFSTVVLDEADRMLDMGFITDMRWVMDLMPKERQTLFFSATISPTIEKLVGEFLKDPVKISVKKRDTSKNVDQDVIKIKDGETKLDVLHNLLIQNEFKKVLVFGKTKHSVEKLSELLTARGFKAESIHGNKNHSQRQRALLRFKQDQAQVLVATDVVARGVDISDVSHVINFDIPQTYDDYVHRIGRTGRAGKTGKVITFV